MQQGKEQDEAEVGFLLSHEGVSCFVREVKKKVGLLYIEND